jgi:hypothetical protein
MHGILNRKRVRATARELEGVMVIGSIRPVLRILSFEIAKVFYIDWLVFRLDWDPFGNRIVFSEAITSDGKLG